jgi:thiol-disulfide isomerase/thioredoxin
MNEAATSSGGADRWLRRGLLAALAVGVGGVLYFVGASSIKPDDGVPKPVAAREIQSFAKGQLAGLETTDLRRPAPDTPMIGPDDRPVRLADYKGEVLVVNLWATWCAPCKTEMPSLARLQSSLPAGVQVLPVSVDSAAKLADAKAFIGQNTPLPFHHSPDAALAWALEAKGFPTTIIYDKRGFERARLSKAAEWDAPEARALLQRLAAEPA